MAAINSDWHDARRYLPECAATDIARYVVNELTSKGVKAKVEARRTLPPDIPEIYVDIKATGEYIHVSESLARINLCEHTHLQLESAEYADPKMFDVIDGWIEMQTTKTGSYR